MKKIFIAVVMLLFIVVSAWCKDTICFDAGLFMAETINEQTFTHYDFVKDKPIVETGRNEGDFTEFYLGLDYFHLHNNGCFGYGLKTGVTLGDYEYETMDYDVLYTSVSACIAPQLGFEFGQARVRHRIYACPVNLRCVLFEDGESEHFPKSEKIPSGSVFSAGTVLGYSWQHGKGKFKKGFVAGLETNWYNLVRFDGEGKGNTGDGFSLWAAFRMSYSFD